MIFTHEDITWIKNVKRDGGIDWAYMDEHVGDVFPLHWRKDGGETNAGKPRVNELIVLFQTAEDIPGYEGTYLTHIVAPIDNIVHPDENNESHPYFRWALVVAKANNPIPKPEAFSFQNVGYGWVHSIELIKSKINYEQLSINSKKNIVWNIFDDKYPQLKSIINLATEDDDQDDGVLEGSIRLKKAEHKFHERNKEIILKKKIWAEKHDKMHCCVCKFDFFKTYGTHGKNFIECHHTVPIAIGGERTTKLEDLELVCSNCHRMLHRRNDIGGYYSIADLINILL